MDTSSPPDPCQIIVIAWTDSDSEFVRERRTDLGERPVIREVTIVKALVWLNEGTAADVVKAHAYADPRGSKVFTYPLDTADPLGAARKAMLKTIPADRRPRS
jgi:hypothetical protein